MAILLYSTNNEYIFQDPISVKAVQVLNEGEVIEKTVTHPFCSLSLDREYSFDKNLVLFCKALNPKIADYYVRLTAAFHEERNQDDDFGQTVFDDDKPEEPDDDDKIFLIIPETKNIH